MYLRLVQTLVDPNRAAEFSAIYTNKILPALARTPGCLYAALVLNTRKRDSAVSLSLWRSKGDADAYEKTGLYREFVDLSRPFFSDATTWKLRLSEDMRLEYGPVNEEPVVRTYVGVDEHGTSDSGVAASCGFLRIVSMQVQAGQAEVFTRLYRDHVLAALRREPGCCSIQLAQSVSDPLEFISFTIWESRQAAECYETSGRFEGLRQILQPTLSTLYQWKLKQHSDPGVTTATSEDMSVEAYVVLTSRTFGGGHSA